jgi:hypothetical protein
MFLYRIHTKRRNQNDHFLELFFVKKKHTIVDYALKESNKPIVIANYSITSTLPKELCKVLPSPAQILKY